MSCMYVCIAPAASSVQMRARMVPQQMMMADNLQRRVSIDALEVYIPAHIHTGLLGLLGLLGLPDNSDNPIYIYIYDNSDNPDNPMCRPR